MNEASWPSLQGWGCVPDPPDGQACALSGSRAVGWGGRGRGRWLRLHAGGFWGQSSTLYFPRLPRCPPQPRMEGATAQENVLGVRCPPACSLDPLCASPPHSPRMAAEVAKLHS